MDFVTHSLVGVGIGRLVSPRRDLIPQYALAGLLASTLQDGDSWLYLIDPSFYGKYHRVVSHSMIGLVVIALMATLLCGLVFLKPSWRRFGFFVSENLPGPDPPERAGFHHTLLVALLAAYTHATMDAITGFGNILPFWPLSWWDASIHAVNSFDAVIFSLTLAWHVATRSLPLTRRREALLSAGYALALCLYVVICWKTGSNTVW